MAMVKKKAINGILQENGTFLTLTVSI